MRDGRCWAALLDVLLWGAAGHADITNTTPYDYDSPPTPGKERGTYMAAGTGSLGPDCFFTFIGTAKYLPNRDGSGGKHCTKGNVELTGSGAGCAFKPFESMLVVVESDYTYNGDGTLCERARLIGGPLPGSRFARATSWKTASAARSSSESVSTSKCSRSSVTRSARAAPASQKETLSSVSA